MVHFTDIEKQARTWLGTKFHHQGRLKAGNGKSGGVDCIGLILGVAEELGLKSREEDSEGNRQPFSIFDRADYALEPSGQLLQEAIEKRNHVEKVDLAEIRTGDILLFKIIKHPQHVGFLSSHPHGGNGIIHCYSGVGKVVEHLLTERWLSRLVAAYRFSEVSWQR